MPSTFVDFVHHATLRNGTPVLIRAIRPDDRQRIVAAFRKLDAQTIYTRFFTAKRELSEADLGRIDSSDFVHAAILVATLGEGDDEIIVGGGAYTVNSPPEAAAVTAEVSFTIEEDYHGQGLAGIFLRLLIAIGRERGIRRFDAEVLAGNPAMLAVFQHCGLPMRKRSEDGVVHVEMDLGDPGCCGDRLVDQPTPGEAPMSHDVPRHALQLRSLVRGSGELEVSLQRVPVGEPAADEVVLRVQATPINPSDLGLLFGAADLSTLKASGTPDNPVVSASIPEKFMKAMAARVDQSLPVGNEGAGVVVKAGSSPAAQALLGKTVAGIGGEMYAQYRCLKVAQCLVLPPDASAADGASCFVNPLTALGMVETMRREGHSALVHTAAASNLGQMLNRICLKDGIALVNIVRKAEQEKILRDAGAKHVCSTASENFLAELTEALVETGATIAFDAIGGGKLPGQILSCMEAALNRKATEYSRYGSPVHKQVYLYGMLDPGPTELHRSFGMAWGIGGWLLFPFLQKIGPEGGRKLRERVAAELKTTFASHYTRTVSLAGALQPEAIALYAQRATGTKVLIDPSRN